MILDEVGLSFDDVLLMPQHSSLRKREAANISSLLHKPVGILDVPIVSAPMASVTEHAMANAMFSAGGYGIIHRFMDVGTQVDEYSKTGDASGVAIGVNEGYERWEALYIAGCRVFCLDIAHAHHDTVSDFLSNVPPQLRADTILIAGNVATPEGFLFLARLGVDCIKIGIGPGAACTTREVTGFGVPQLTAIMLARRAQVVHGLSAWTTIMADGGIKNSGDIVKALAAGADTVMIGKLLAGCEESPHPGLYWGMASVRVNGHWAPEGVEGAVTRSGPVKETIKRLAWGIRSGVSYGGGTNLSELREYAQFMKVSPLSTIESGVRV